MFIWSYFVYFLDRLVIENNEEMANNVKKMLVIHNQAEMEELMQDDGDVDALQEGVHMRMRGRREPVVVDGMTRIVEVGFFGPQNAPVEAKYLFGNRAPYHGMGVCGKFFRAKAAITEAAQPLLCNGCCAPPTALARRAGGMARGARDSISRMSRSFVSGTGTPGGGGGGVEMTGPGVGIGRGQDEWDGVDDEVAFERSNGHTHL